MDQKVITVTKRQWEIIKGALANLQENSYERTKISNRSGINTKLIESNIRFLNEVNEVIKIVATV